jgi:hypothetical protein
MPTDSTTAPLPIAPAAGQSAGIGRLVTAGLVLVGVILLGGGVVPWWLSQPSRVTAWIVRNVPNLQGKVEMGRATFTWLGPIVFEDVVVVPTSGAREPVVIRRVEAEHGIAAFLFSGGDVGHVRIEGFETHLVFDADRNSNVKGLFASPGGPDHPTGAPKKTPLRMEIDVDDAIVRIEGPWSPDPWISEPIDLALRLAKSATGDTSEWTVHPTTIFEDAKLEPSVAQGVLAYIAPVLADATRTAGRFSLSIDGGTFPVGAPEKSRIAGRLTMHEVDLGPGPMVTGILQAIPGKIQLPTSIRVADDSRISFKLEDRRVWHEGLEFGVPLPKVGSRLDLVSSGSVGLDDKVLDLKLALPIPAGMPADRPVLASLGGKTVSIGIGGVLGQPKVEFDGSIRNVTADVIVGVLDRLLTRGPAGDATPPRPGSTATLPPAAPRPGWFRRPSAGAAERDDRSAGGADGSGDAGRHSESSGAPESLPAPPPRPGWSPIKRPGVGAQTAGAASSAPLPGDDVAGSGEPGPLADAEDARALETAAESPAGSKQGTAEVLDAIKDRVAPQLADNPQADRVIDLVGGLIDEVARRRAERAAAEAASPSQQGQQPGQQPPPPRRGRLLRRLLPADRGTPPPPPQ